MEALGSTYVTAYRTAIERKSKEAKGTNRRNSIIKGRLFLQFAYNYLSQSEEPVTNVKDVRCKYP